MPLQLSQGAVTTKIKSMYGRRLTLEQYRALMQKRSVAEAAAYLKDETGYGEALASVQPASIHRGQLETLLRKTRFNRYSRLMQYEFQADSFYNYILQEIEIEQILTFLRLLNINRPEEYILQYPAFIEKRASFSLRSLAGVRSFDALLEALEATPYADLLRPFRPTGAEPINYTRCEAALQSDYYERLHKSIHDRFSKKTAAALDTIFETYIELTNINNILRCKAYFPKTPPEEIRECLLPTHGRIPRRFMEELLAQPDLNSAKEALTRSPYVKYTGGKDTVFIEYERNRTRYRLCRHHLRFATKAPLVFVSYMILNQIEINNITTIIEGIRYGLPGNEIEKLIITE